MKRSYKHMIDFLFPIALFFVFASTAIVVVLLSANIYKGVVSDSESNFQTSTALSYITQKVHQHDDSSNQIYLDEFDGYEALAITQEYQNQTYITYIYAINGELKESFLQEGTTASAKSGTTIMEIGDLIIEPIEDSLFKLTCISTSGNTSSTIITINSH